MILIFFTINWERKGQFSALLEMGQLIQIVVALLGSINNNTHYF